MPEHAKVYRALYGAPFLEEIQKAEKSIVGVLPTGILNSSRHDIDVSDEDSMTTIFDDDSYDVSSQECSSSRSETDGCSEDPLWEDRWLALQERFAARDRVLHRMETRKSTKLMRLIRKREHFVRQKEREMLILKYAPMTRHDLDDQIFQKNRIILERVPGVDLSISLTDSDSSVSSADTKSDYVWFDAQENADTTRSEEVRLPSRAHHEAHSDTFASGQTLFRRVCDALLFELYTVPKCIMCLIVHSIAHASLSDGLEIAGEEFRKVCELVSEASPVSFDHNLAGDIVMFSTGLFLLRISGVLYWWLNTEDFHVVKFEYHNRLRQGQWDARILAWVRRNYIAQWMLYFIGYIICFKVIDDRFEKSFVLFDQRETILENLPSLRDQAFGMCIEHGTPFYASSCQDEIVRLQAAEGKAFAADFDYLWSTLYFKKVTVHTRGWFLRGRFVTVFLCPCCLSAI